MKELKINARLTAALKSCEENVEYLTNLSCDQQAKLAEQLKHARSKQHAHVRCAAVDAINHLPRLLRRPLLKMFEGNE